MFTEETIIKLEDLTSRMTFLIGKNGSGKSTQLRNLSITLANQHPDWYCSYISPERGGNLVYDSGIESNMVTNPTWTSSTRQINQFSNFKQQSFSQFSILERKINRLISTDKKLRYESSYTFSEEIEKVNNLLPRIKLIQSENGFLFKSKDTEIDIHNTRISSGESELVSLAIEVLEFSTSSQGKEKRLLLLDEPDVHLHPDLQSKFIEFVYDQATSKDFKVVIGTHSTALIGGLRDKSDT